MASWPLIRIAGLARGATALLTVARLATGSVEAQTATNLALGKPVISSGANWGGFKPGALTDGDLATITHPLADQGTLGFYYEVDLGRGHRFDRILLHNRADGCCPERLSRFRVEVYDDDGDDGPGTLNWSAAVRADGSHSGTSGTDTITADLDPDGTFAGRFVRVVNASDAAYNPQLAEIEVFGGLAPTVRQFVVDQDVLVRGQATTLRWQLERAEGAIIQPDVGSVPPEAGSVEIRPERTTPYTLVAINENGAVSRTVTVGVDVVLRPPELTEFLAENRGGLKDEEGESPDWIELRNPNPFHLPVGGYGLTDDPADPGQWTLPDVRIPPEGFLVVFASGHDRRDPRSPLHTNFRLDANGDTLALVDRDGTTLLDRFPVDAPAGAPFPPQTPNVGYGRGANGVVGYLPSPTPGATNGPAYAGVLGDVTFEPGRGFYTSNVVVTLSVATPGTVIRYTTNQTEPTATRGLLYDGPIAVNRTTVIRAAAFRDGWSPGTVRTHTYLFPTQVIASSVMRRSITGHAVYGPQLPAALSDVPSVSLVAPAAFNDTTRVKTSVEWLDPEDPNGFQENCGVRLFGGAFTDFAKKSFRLYFQAEFGASRLRYPLFRGHENGLEPVVEFDQLELRNGSHDMEMRGFYLSNAFTDDTLREMGHVIPHGRFVHLYLNGTYWGLYHLRERWNAAMLASYLGGSRTNYEAINGNWNVGGWPDPGVPYDGDGSTWTHIKSIRNRYSEIRRWVDVPQYIDYMIVWFFGGCEDEYRCVGSTEPAIGFRFHLNDADGWFCIPNYCQAGNRTSMGGPGRQGGDGPGSLFSMLFREADPDYRTLLADRIHRALSPGGALSTGRTAARLHRLSAAFERPFLAESARWNYLTPTAWQTRRDGVLADWLPRRPAEVLADLRGAGFYPRLDPPDVVPPDGPVTAGTELRIDGPAGATIYYTLDGSDPRSPGGAVATSATALVLGGQVETAIPAGSVWRWFTDATGLGPGDLVEGQPGWSAGNWKHPDFDDRTWNAGPAQLGYGENDEATRVPFGPDAANKWTTIYFRHRFLPATVEGLTSAEIRLRRDDGAVLYLNGRELGRSSMPTGTVSATTPANNASDDGQSFVTLPVPISMFRPGTNVLAVELHQAAPNSSDASFDLELVLVRSGVAAGDPPRITRNTLFRARSRQGSTWSAVVERWFQVGEEPVSPGEVVIDELQFHPPFEDGAEFVELRNVSARAVNLRGARFVDGIDFAFPNDRDVPLPAGHRWVLVQDLFRFRRRYGDEPVVAGRFGGRLDNQGERLTLADASGRPIFTARYDRTPPWPVDTDGGGPSLVLARPDLGTDNPFAWRESVRPGGTPGGTDAEAFLGDPGADRDGDGLPALVEYALGASDEDAASGPGWIGVDRSLPGHFALHFPRRLAADDVTPSIELSTDLIHWQPALPLSTRAGPPGMRWETWGVRVPDRTDTTAAWFLRLRVTRG